MTALKLSVAAGELAGRIRDRLRGINTTTRKVVWQEADDRVLLHLDTLTVRLVEGWLLVGLDAQTDQTGRQNLQFVYYLGKTGEGDGIQAGSTVNAATTGASQIAAVWGDDFQRVIWEAVLDVVEASIHHATTQKPGEKVTLQGFHCTSEAMHVDVITGEI